MTLIEKLEDLLKQATKERSHYYVASVVRETIAELKRHKHLDKVDKTGGNSIIIARCGILFREIPLPEADTVARKHGYNCAEEMVRALGLSSQREAERTR